MVELSNENLSPGKKNHTAPRLRTMMKSVIGRDDTTGFVKVNAASLKVGSV